LVEENEAEAGGAEIEAEVPPGAGAAGNGAGGEDRTADRVGFDRIGTVEIWSCDVPRSRRCIGFAPIEDRNVRFGWIGFGRIGCDRRIGAIGLGRVRLQEPGFVEAGADRGANRGADRGVYFRFFF
jgi:hypothetical protein